MSITSIVSSEYTNQSSRTTNHSLIKKYAASNSSTDAAKTDSLEISSEAYEMQENSKKMSATSGKDTLGITKGTGDDSYVVHLYDGAMVSRAISRGYITVNGTDIHLTDDVKKQLTAVDKQAQAKREAAYNKYIMQHEMAVAKQQSESLKHAFDFDENLLLLLGLKKNEDTLSDDRPKEGVNWSQFEWKYYETTMDISMNGTPKIQGIQENEIILNKAK